MSEWIAGTSSISPGVDGYEDFEAGLFKFEGIEKAVYKSGTGPAVIVIHEIPGLYDKVFDFARRLNRSGFTTYLPSLIGVPGKPLTTGYGISSMAKLCIRKEFNRFAKGKEAPISNWLRGLSRHCHSVCGGPGVGAVGMCFSGGFALAMMVDSSVIAPVLSQPSMPFGFSNSRKSDIDVNRADLPKIKQHMTDVDTCLLGLRFTNDVLVPEERFDYLKQEFGDRFVSVNIDSSPGNPHNIKSSAHSVLANDYVDTPEHPTYKALELVLDLFRKQLLNTS